MKICIIGKFPPIQGGVSKATSELAIGLSVLGHEVYVVTNANEVELPYRIFTSELFPKINLPDNLSVHYTSAHNQLYIPFAKPYVSKLAGLAKKIINQHQCDLILAIYLEPYGVAAQLASVWTNVPFMVTHAGSDVGRLITNPNLKETYQELFNHCHGILTRPKMIPFFKDLNIPSEKVLIKGKDLGTRIEDFVATDQGGPLDLNRYIDQVSQLELSFLKHYIAPFLNNKIEPDSFVIGMYGKVGKFKGNIELLRAVAQLDPAIKSRVFLVFLTQGPENELKEVIAAIQELGLANRMFILPFIPSYMIGSFIRACHCICFLEDQFPIDIHMPSVPREVLREGGCLVLSQEIAKKQSFHQQMIHFENIVLVSPSDIENMSAEIGRLVQNPYLANSIGKAGKSLIKNENEDDKSNHNERFANQILHITQAHFSKRRSFDAYFKRRQLYFEYVFSYTSCQSKAKFGRILRQFLKSEYLQQNRTVEEQMIDLYSLLLASSNSKSAAMATFDYNYFQSVLSIPRKNTAPLDIDGQWEKIKLSDHIALQKMDFDLVTFKKTRTPTLLVFKPKNFFGESGVLTVSDDTYRILTYFKDQGSAIFPETFLDWASEKGYDSHSARKALSSLIRLGLLS